MYKEIGRRELINPELGIPMKSLNDSLCGTCRGRIKDFILFWEMKVNFIKITNDSDSQMIYLP